jgi:hypothetical protein
MIPFVRTDASIMRRIVYYSILLRNIKIALLQLRFTKLMISDLGMPIPSHNDLNNVESQLMSRERQLQQSCKLLLSPLFEGIDFGNDYLNHWAVSMIDIKRGYCELEEILQYDIKHRPKMFGRRFVMLLEDYKDPTLGIYRSGELIKISTAIHFIDNIPESNDKVKGIFDAMINNINMAMTIRKSMQQSNGNIR